MAASDPSSEKPQSTPSAKSATDPVGFSGGEKEDFRSIFENAQIGIYRTSPDGRILMANPSLVAMLGYDSFEELARLNINETNYGMQRERRLFQEKMREKGFVRGFESVWERKDGSPIEVRENARAVRNADGQIVFYDGSVEDITESKRVHSQLRRLTRTLRMLVSCNETLVRVSEQDRLLREITQLIVTVGGYRMAFVGFAEDEGEKIIRVAAHAGFEAGYFQSVRILWDEKDPRGNGPTGMAVRSGKPVVIRDIMEDDRMAPWREEAEKRGFRASISLPFRLETGAVGAVNIYSVDGGVFDAEEVELLSELVANIGYGLNAIHARDARLRAEARYRDVSAQFEAFFSLSADMMVVAGFDGYFKRANPALVRTLGYSEEELLSRPFTDFVHPDDCVVTTGELAAITDGADTDRFENRYVTRSGDVRVFSWASARLPDEEIIFGVARDITDQRKAERILKESEEKYRLLFENNPLSMWVCDIETLRIIAVNDSAVQNYGYSRSEFLSMTLRDIRPEGDRERFEAYVRSSDFSSTGVMKTWRHEKKDGSVIDAEVVAHAIQFEGRRCRFIQATDVTKRKRAEDLIREQAALLDKATDAIIVRDLDDIIRYWNKGAERLYGWTSNEVLGNPAENFFSGEAAVVGEAFDQLRKRGEWVGELRHATKNGHEVTVESRWTLIRDDGGAERSVLLIDTDISDKKVLEARFLRAQRMESLGTLAGGIAHDLNNVLSPIVMSVALLETMHQDEETLSILRTLEQSAKRGSDMVRQVLSFARGVDGKRLRLRPATLLRELEGIVKDTFPRSINLKVEISPDVGYVVGDPTQIHQILLNLAVNARDAMPGGGDLIFAVDDFYADESYASMQPNCQIGRYVVFRVTDSGAGVPESIRERIFDPFFTTKEVGKGTGLGLSTVAAIAKSHDGFVSLYSEIGKGTTFKIYLPAFGDLDEEFEPIRGSEPKRGQGEYVLVVDDEASILRITQQTLEAFGYRVVTAGDGAEALSRYVEHRSKIALVLTDMMMPVMDGATLIYALLKLDPKVKIIAASGLNANGAVAKAAGAGVKHFLPKPYTAEALLAAVYEILHPSAS